ncbi:MAG: hypothetical protein IJY82_06490 [Oscillospiraceae bacterium]|nr:hypothetical protein [Oscillospiraceae bacterium]MBQ8732458.1 hypothetical protein [Oscillospiraceae bacterium]
MESFLMYKGKPLVRCGNMIYYGSMQDEYVVMMRIVSTKEEFGMKVCDKVSVQLMSTKPGLSPKDMILKKSDKEGLYNAIDIASIWLERVLAN